VSWRASKARASSSSTSWLLAAALFVLCFIAPAAAQSPVHTGRFPAGPNDAITDVPGVRVGNVTFIEGEGALDPGHGPFRTGATAIIPNADPWTQNVAAAFFTENGNGEMTGMHYVDEFGYLQTPVVLTDTLDVGRAYDGVVDWMIKQHPNIGVRGGVPLPIVAECDDQGFNDIQGRRVRPADVVTLLDGARGGQFPRGDVGAGTGMHAFAFKGGIGSASRVLDKSLGGYTVGVLVNVNTGINNRGELVVDGVHVGRALLHELLPVFPNRRSADIHGRAADGSIVVVVGTDAPLDPLTLKAIAKRVTLGLGRVGMISHESSGDLFLAFSTTRTISQDEVAAGKPLETDTARIDALFEATADATEAAVYDALFSAKTMTGANGVTLYGLPWERVRPMLQRAR
jgi:D-aminopeptidase